MLKKIITDTNAKGTDFSDPERFKALIEHRLSRAYQFQNTGDNAKAVEQYRKVLDILERGRRSGLSIESLLLIDEKVIQQYISRLSDD